MGCKRKSLDPTFHLNSESGEGDEHEEPDCHEYHESGRDCCIIIVIIEMIKNIKTVHLQPLNGRKFE